MKSFLFTNLPQNNNNNNNQKDYLQSSQINQRINENIQNVLKNQVDERIRKSNLLNENNDENSTDSEFDKNNELIDIQNIEFEDLPYKDGLGK